MEPHDDLYSTDREDSSSSSSPTQSQYSSPLPMNFSASFTFSQPISTQGTKKRKKRSEPQLDSAQPPVHQRLHLQSPPTSPLPPIQDPFATNQWRNPLNIQYPFPPPIQFPNPPFRLPETLNPMNPPIISNINISNLQPQVPILSRHVSTVVTNTSYSSGRWVLQEHPSGRQITGSNKYLVFCYD